MESRGTRATPHPLPTGAETKLLSIVRGCTFDDFLFTPQFSVLERRDPARST